MTTKLFALTFSIILLLSQPLFLFGQSGSQQQDWAAVQSLPTGVKLLIETKDGKRLKGKLSNVSATTLSITRNNSPAGLNKDDIQKIYQLRGGSRSNSVIIGAGAGAGLGIGAAAIALGSTGGSDDTGGILIIGTLIGTGIGAAIGAAFGKSSRRVLIYESR